MTATVYLSVADGELRAEDEGGKVRIVVGNFAWTFVLEDRLDCARWAKVIADADALFIRRKHASADGAAIETVTYDPHPGEPLPERVPAGPPGADQEQADATSILLKWGAKPDEVAALAAPPMETELSGQAPAGAEPPGQMAPEPEEDEVKR